MLTVGDSGASFKAQFTDGLVKGCIPSGFNRDRDQLIQTEYQLTLQTLNRCKCSQDVDEYLSYLDVEDTFIAALNSISKFGCTDDVVFWKINVIDRQDFLTEDNTPCRQTAITLLVTTTLITDQLCIGG